MKVTTATLVSEQIYETVHSVSEKDNVIGYISKTENEEFPIGAVLADGTDLGEFDCPNCAVKEIYRKANNITDAHLITDNEKSEMLLAFMKVMLAGLTERTTH
ncbi:hypothetical protein [Serratia marcescens]|uniref:hypothetical protein n=1 Tax=Serratia marcescens TaxID=615 RepID=UPI003204A43D